MLSLREWLRLYAQRAWLKLLLLLVAWLVWEAMKSWLFGFLNSWLEAQQFSINEWLLPAIEYLRQNPAILSLFVPVSVLTIIIYKTYRKLEAERLLENGKSPPLRTEAESAPTMELTEAISGGKLLEEDGPRIEIHFEDRPPFKEYVEPRRLVCRVALQSDKAVEGVSLVVKRLIPKQKKLGSTDIPLTQMHDNPYVNQDGRLRSSLSLVPGRATHIDVVSKDLDTRLLSLEHTRQTEGPHLFKDGAYVLELETTGSIRVSRDFVLRVPASGRVLFYPLDPPPTRNEGLSKLARLRDKGVEFLSRRPPDDPRSHDRWLEELWYEYHDWWWGEAWATARSINKVGADFIHTIGNVPENPWIGRHKKEWHFLNVVSKRLKALERFAEHNR